MMTTTFLSLSLRDVSPGPDARQERRARVAVGGPAARGVRAQRQAGGAQEEHAGQEWAGEGGKRGRIEEDN